MFTHYGPYDVQQVELILHDKQRRMEVIYTLPTFEGVSVRVDGAYCAINIGSHIRTILAGLLSVFASVAQPLHRQIGRV